jgi:hypothetical protein
MKINYKHILSLITAGIACGMALPCAAGPTVIITAPAPPTVVITAPAPPPVTPVVVVPDTYIYDGDEYVGVVGGQYYYLGPGGAWVVMDPVRVHRFQVYVHDHPDWHGHMVHNVKYRGVEHVPAHAQPVHDTHDHPQMNDHRDHDDHHGPPQ